MKPRIVVVALRPAFAAAMLMPGTLRSVAQRDDGLVIHHLTRHRATIGAACRAAARSVSAGMAGSVVLGAGPAP